MNPIEELSPKGVWRNFYALTQIPRPSGHTEKVANYLVDWAKSKGAEAYIDEAGNVIMRKGATPGYEDRETTVLQAHMDIVPHKTKGIGNLRTLPDTFQGGTHIQKTSVRQLSKKQQILLIHLYFNLVGTLLFTVVFYSCNAFLHFSFLQNTAGAADIAVIHSLFNIGCTVVLFPFSGLLVRLAQISIPEDGKEAAPRLPEPLQVLDERFLDRPAFAMSLCKEAVNHMADLARNSFQQAMAVLDGYTENGLREVIAQEQEADQYEDVLGTYLVKLSARDLNQTDSRTLSILLHCINDFERISDHAINVAESAKELHDKGLTLSRESRAELAAYGKAVSDILDLTVGVFAADDTRKAKGVEPQSISGCRGNDPRGFRPWKREAENLQPAAVRKGL